MKRNYVKRVLSLLLMTVVLGCRIYFYPMNARAAGLDLKSQINSASSGDVISVPAGTYDLTMVPLYSVDNITLDFTGSTLIGGDGNCAVRVDNSKNVTVIGGTFYPSSKYAGVGIRVLSGKVTFKNCVFKNYGEGARIDGGNVEFINCKISNIYKVGITVNGKKTKVTYNGGTVEKCGMHSAGKSDSNAAGIGVYKSGNLVAKNASFKNNGGCGITANNKGTIKVYGCTVSGNGDHGIGAGPNCTLEVDRLKVNGKYKNNTVKNNKCDGILLQKSSSAKKIAYVTSEKNGRDGIAVFNNAKADNIKNCKSNKNKRYGIVVDTNSTVKTIDNCQANQNKSCGIVANEKGTIKTLKNTQVNKNSVFGLLATSNSKIKKVTKCKIGKNKQADTIIRVNSSIVFK